MNETEDVRRTIIVDDETESSHESTPYVCSCGAQCRNGACKKACKGKSVRLDDIDRRLREWR